MIDILIKNNNNIVINNKTKHAIIQYSSSVDNFRILVNKFYNINSGDMIDMSDFKCVMEYLLPNSKKYKIIELEKIEEKPASNSGGDYPPEDKYADYLKYRVPINSELTEEAGDVELQFTFAKKNDEEKIIRKTEKTKITVTPITEWSNVRIDVFNKELDEILKEEVPSL